MTSHFCEWLLHFFVIHYIVEVRSNIVKVNFAGKEEVECQIFLILLSNI
jgi:hypothetical protein